MASATWGEITSAEGLPSLGKAGRAPFDYTLSFVLQLRKSTKNLSQGNSGSQEISRLLLSPKVYYRVHKSPQPALVLSHMNQIYAFHPYFPKDPF
jgi:hypothetical protein